MFEKEDEDKDSLNYLLEEAGYSEKESIKIMNIVDVVVRNKNQYTSLKGFSSRQRILILKFIDLIWENRGEI